VFQFLDAILEKADELAVSTGVNGATPTIADLRKSFEASKAAASTSST
jgi:hypothetical protein